MEPIQNSLQRVLKSPSQLGKQNAFSPNDEDLLLDWMGELALNRSTTISPEQQVICLKNLCNLDRKYTLDDIREAMHDLAEAGRGEGESAWPAWKTMREAIEQAERRRTLAQRKAEANARYAAIEAHADRIRQEREAEWNRRKAEKLKTAS